MKSCASCKFIECWSWSWDDPMSEGRYRCKLTKEWVGADYIDPPGFEEACERYEKMPFEGV